MKSYLSLMFLYSGIFLLNAQNVGVNTEEPTETLDINGTLRIRNLDKNVKQVYNLVSDAEGVVIKGPINNFVEAGNIYASNKVDIGYGGANGINQNTPDLGVQKEIKVPAGRKYAVVIQISVPVGLITGRDFPHYKVFSNSGGRRPRIQEYTFPRNFSGYVGVRLLKDGVEQKEASRKVTIPQKVVINSSAAMTTIASNFYDVIDNTRGTSEKSVIYKLQGYLETTNNSTNSIGGSQPQSLDSGTIRFNMYDKGNQNYNWGYSSLSYQLYWLSVN